MSGHHRDTVISLVIRVQVGDEGDLIEEALQPGTLVVNRRRVDALEIIGGILTSLDV